VQIQIFSLEKPQWKTDLSNESYHADKTAVSSTALKKILKSPKQFYSHFVLDELKQTPTPSMRLGSLFHMCLLEPARFRETYQMMPEFKGTGARKAKAEWLLKSETEGSVICTDKELITLEGMINSLLKHNDACNMMKSGVAEISGYYTDPKTGILCRIRPDFFEPDLMALVDIKTTMDCTYSEFSKSIWGMRYDFQMAMYCAGIEIITGKKVQYPVFIAVEKTPPYEIGMYTADDGIMGKGLQDYQKALDLLKACIEKNEWPGYQLSVQSISLPYWALEKD
jgi:hypothetical protein